MPFERLKFKRISDYVIQYAPTIAEISPGTGTPPADQPPETPPPPDEFLENYRGINLYYSFEYQRFYFRHTVEGIEVRSVMYVKRQEAIDAINKLTGYTPPTPPPPTEPPTTGIRLNPLPWTGWYEWHSSQYAKSTFPKGGYSTLEASDYVSTSLKLAITKQDLHLKLKELNLKIRFTVAVESVDDTNFLRMAIVPRIDPATGINNSKALYTEYTFFTGKNTNSQSGGNYKERKIANMPINQIFQTFEFPLSDHLKEDWGQTVYDSYMISYLAPTIEMRKGAAKILVSDVSIYG